MAEPFEEVWRAAKDQTIPHGPVGTAYKVMREWGWQWLEAFVVRTHKGQEFHLLEAPKSFCKVQYREAAKAAQWAKLRKKKRVKEGDMQGLAEIDERATTALWRGQEAKQRPLDQEGRRFLTKAVTGSFRPISRLYKAGIVGSPLCPFCAENGGTLEEETKEHTFWRCKRWEAIRREALHELQKEDFLMEKPGLHEREGTPPPRWVRWRHLT